MSALATPTLRRLPLAGGAAACAALAAAVLVGPGGTFVPSAVLAFVAVALLGAEVVRRTLVLLRSGLGAQLVLGAMVLVVLGAGWWVIAGFHAEFLAFWMLIGAIGLALMLSGLVEAKARAGRGATPWQALTGGPTAGASARDAFTTIGPILLGFAFVLGALRFAAHLVVDVLLGYRGYLGMVAVAAIVVALIFGWVARGLIVGIFAPRGLAGRPGAGSGAAAAPVAPQRDEQVVAAHLHDSVLQTLALIQRSAADPARVSQLARQQERSLRAWLAGREEAAATTLAGALKAAAQSVEDEEVGAVIEVVAVGDAPLDRETDAMVKAAREAMRNAVRHAGSPVRVFCEVEDGAREVYVRDTGKGFQLDQVGEARRGVRDAIIGRMEHVGGTAKIDSSEVGTEIALRLPAPR